MGNFWLKSVIDRTKILTELNALTQQKIIRSPIIYQRMKDPALLKFYYYAKNKTLIDRLEIEGSSPPDLFIGRIGYPYVFIGPLVAPTKDNTSLLGMPELWVGKNIESIVEFRMQMVRGTHRVKVTDVDTGKIVGLVQELALAKNPADVEAEFTKKPFARIRLDDEVQPYGPSAPLKDMMVSSATTDQKIEKAYYDEDLKAFDAVVNLYEKGSLVSKIQKAFSAGLFGLKKNRKFVPTRWSITAVDSMLSLNLLEKVKKFPLINECRVYETIALDNLWFILMIPSYWAYELIEAWYPKTVWNLEGQTTVMYSSHEFFEGRSTYAEIGGCYYASRLALSEFLNKERRQATVIVFREAHPGYILPVGVWNVREHVRLALRNNPMKFNTIKDASNYIFSKLHIPLKNWFANSNILKHLKFQKKIADYFK